MPTPTDPYSSNSRRPFEDDEILAPLPAASPSSASTPSSSAQVTPPAFVDDSWTDTEIFAHTQGMDPAFDQQERHPEPLDPEPSSPDDAPTALMNNDEAAPVRTSHDDVITDYSAIDYSFGADDTSSATDSYPVSSTQQPSATSVLPTSSPASAPAEAASSFAAPVSLDAPAPEPAPTNAWAAPTPASPMSAAPAAMPVPVPEAPGGRGWTHTWVLFATLLLLPVAWYLLSDASVRLGPGPDTPWTTGSLSWTALVEMASGLVVVALVWFIARLSSLGAIVIGTLVAVAGLIPLLLPTLARSFLSGTLTDLLSGYNTFTDNLLLYLGTDLASGKMLILGVLLLVTGVVSHSARRRGEKYGSITTRREIALGSAK